MFLQFETPFNIAECSGNAARQRRRRKQENKKVERSTHCNLRDTRASSQDEIRRNFKNEIDSVETIHKTPYQGEMLILDAAQATLHLDILGLNEWETNLRFIPHKGLKRPAINGIFGEDLLRAQSIQNYGYGVYIQPNPGGTLANQVTKGVALFHEHDDISKTRQLRLWKQCGLPEPTLQIDTGGKSIHQYYVLHTPISICQWASLTDRLIAHVSSDRSCKGANRMMRLAGSFYIDSNGHATARCTIVGGSGNRYSIKLLEELLPPLTPRRPTRRRLKTTGTFRTKGARQIHEALSHIPRRVPGRGTYANYRNILWGLIATCNEAGYGKELAIDLMEDHSPSDECGWDIRQIAESGGDQVGAGSFWWHAQQHGWGGGHA
jgi:hypothetical protein